MNKKNMFLTGLLAISAMQITLPAEDQQNQKQCNNNALSNTAASIISGGLIGAITGKLSSIACRTVIATTGAFALIASTEKKSEAEACVSLMILITAIGIPSILIAENALRTRLTNSINESLEENEVNHRKKLIHDTAWLASWIAFLV
jgi:hypothetical protein